MLFTTIETIPGQEIVEVHGLVSGSVVRSKDIVKDIGASLKSIVGGQLRSYTALMQESREEALRELQGSAESVGANAVVGLRMTAGQIAPGAAEIYIYGTAVTLADE